MRNYQNWAEEHLLLWEQNTYSLLARGSVYEIKLSKNVCVINLSRNIEIKVFNERNLFSVWFRTCPTAFQSSVQILIKWKHLQLLQNFWLASLKLLCRMFWEIAVATVVLSTRVGCLATRIWTLKNIIPPYTQRI